MMLRVVEGGEDNAAASLHRLVTEQQWRHDWSIKRVWRIHIGATRSKLGQFGPRDECVYNFLLAVKAANQPTLVKKALPAISKAVGHRHRTRHHHRAGHVLISADESNGP